MLHYNRKSSILNKLNIFRNNLNHKVGMMTGYQGLARRMAMMNSEINVRSSTVKLLKGHLYEQLGLYFGEEK